MEENSVFVCDNCGEEFPMEESNRIGDDQLCDSCFGSLTTTCEYCGATILSDEARGDDNVTLCADCEDEHYSYCNDCERLIHNQDVYYLEEDDDDTPYCYDCYQEHMRSAIHEYSYKPAPLFYGSEYSNDRYLGVELEIDDGGKDSDHARLLLEIANEEEERAYIKTDSSLDDGLEIVTHPMTLGYHKTLMPWKSVVEKAVSLGYRSHQSGTCGLHVHISRNSFGATHEEQEASIGRLLFLVEAFWNPLLKFSRRTQRQLEKWAARYGLVPNPKAAMDNAKKSGGCRYTCVNLCNYNTVEIRIFRGTLKYNTLMATLELADKLCELATDLTDEEITELS